MEMKIIGSKKFDSIEKAIEAASGPNTIEAFAELLGALDVDAGDVCHNTYLYVSGAGEIVACNKRSHQTEPSDQTQIIGYLTAYTPNINGIRKSMGGKSLNESGTSPDTSLFLGCERRAWLQEQGGIQPTITRLIDDTMNKGGKHESNR